LSGLPGSGKTCLSRELARKLGALRWDKDELRELLFPAAVVKHERVRNDFCMETLYAAARGALEHASLGVPIVLLDGRPFTEKRQRTRAVQAAGQAGANIAFILCVAPLVVLRQRIASDRHIAPDRNEALLDRLVAAWEPFDGDEILVDTSALSPGEAALRCINELEARRLVDSRDS